MAGTLLQDRGSELQEVDQNIILGTRAVGGPSSRRGHRGLPSAPPACGWPVLAAGWLAVPSDPPGRCRGSRAASCCPLDASVAGVHGMELRRA